MRKNLINKILVIFIILFILTFFINTKIFASDDIDTNKFKTTVQYSDATDIFDKGIDILKVIRNIAVIVSVLVITIVGIKYMIGSVEEKANYKETMKPILIGGILIGGLASILTAIQSFFN